MSLEVILREPAVATASGLPRSTLWHRVKHGLFTKPVHIGPRSVGWPESEVAAINRARIAAKTDDQIRELVRQLTAARQAAA